MNSRKRKTQPKSSENRQYEFHSALGARQERLSITHKNGDSGQKYIQVKKKSWKSFRAV